MDGHEIKHKDSAYPSYGSEITQTGTDTGTWRGLETAVFHFFSVCSVLASRSLI